LDSISIEEGLMAEVFAQATVSPTETVAGDSYEFVITLVVGAGYTDGPSRIVYDFPATLGMSRPSLMHREDHGFVEVYVSNPTVTYVKRNFDMELVDFGTRDRTSWRGMAQRLFVLDLSAGLCQGDVIELHWGDAGGGYGAGTKVTTVVPRPDYEAQLHIRYFEGQDSGLPDMGRSFEGYERPVPDADLVLAFKVAPRELHHLRLIRQADRARLVPYDRFWNVADIREPYDGIRIASASTDSGSPTRTELGAWEYADRNVQFLSRRAPLSETPSMHDVFEGLNLYWGDIHTHSAFSKDCIEREKLQMEPGDLMAYARQCAGLDFFAVTDHHQPWDEERAKIGRDRWAETLDAIRAHDRPGEFLVFPGIEFRGPRGDTVVVFGWLPEYKEFDRPEWSDVRRLWRDLEGKDYLSIPHFHNGGKLAEGEWWDHIASGVEPVLEIFSCHGSYERKDVLEGDRSLIKRFRPDRNAAYFLSRGYRYGLVANSDGHKGHVGSNGVTAVFSRSLAKAAILEAYRDRHVYGTTNARIRLVFTGNGKLMGSALPNTSSKTFAIDVVGENRLKRVDVYRDGAPVRRFFPEGKAFHVEFTERDDEPSNWYVRVTQVDNHVAYSSPVWFG
jgi:hypothetical protein